MNKSEIADPISHDEARKLLLSIGGTDNTYLRLCQYVEQQRAIAESQAPQPKSVLVMDFKFCPFCGDCAVVCCGECEGAKSYWKSGAVELAERDQLAEQEITVDSQEPTPVNCTCNADSVYCPFHKRDVKPIPSSFELGADGGINSTTYQCDECKDLLTVSIKPLTIGVSYGVPDVKR
jgi:hypothetical protein